MKNIRFFLSEIFQFLLAKFSIYLNRRVFVMNYLIGKWGAGAVGGGSGLGREARGKWELMLTLRDPNPHHQFP